MSQLPILKVSNLTKTYKFDSKSQKYQGLLDSISNLSNNSIEAVKNISFDLHEGECLGIIGENGAGKSTLLKILSGIVKPTSGNIKYRGNILSILDVGTGFHPDLNGIENIYLNGQMMGYNHRDIKNKINSIVKFSEIDKFIYEPIKTYSSGMYLRLAFSTIIHMNADILIIDEILSVGDLGFQKKCMEHILDLKKNTKVSLIIVSHNLMQISDICDRLILLKKGEIVKDDQTYNTVIKYSLDGENISDDKSISTKGNISKDDIKIISAIKIEDASIKDSNNNIISQFNRLKEFTIEINVSLLKNNDGSNIGFAISDIYNKRLFGGGTIYSDDFSKLSKGDYLVSFKIPGGIFNYGIFIVNAFIFDSNQNVVSKYMSIAKFEIIVDQKDNYGYVPMKFDIKKTITKL